MATAIPTTIAAPKSPPGAAPALGFVGAPPAWLPGVHFGAALAFFASGAVGLVLVAPHLARGSFFLPQVVAVVHLFVLGWLVLSIFGALCQFLPVAIGRQVRWQALAGISFVAQVAGVVAFATGLATSQRGVLYLGASLLTVAFTTFAANLVATLAGARDRALTFWALAGSSLFLVATPAFGFALAMNLHGDVQLASRFATVATHAHVALVGFVMLVIVGVAHRLLPMFLLSHGASEKPAWIAVALLFLGALVLSMPASLGSPRVLAASALTAGGLVAFFVQATLFFKHRKRRAIDPGMRLAAIGIAGMGVALVLAPFALSAGVSNPRLLATYFVVLIGAIGVFVAGHYFKIVPFIVWYHRFGPLVGKQKVPKVSELYSERAATIVGALLVLGWAGIAAGTLAGSAPTVRAFAASFLAGTIVEGILMAQIARRRATT
ncbi:MAG TPA: hypothetical protein VN033_06160 [Vulgatibacter sp.]|nr:hypothetical protein [Vulgatibacter sp.]